MGLRDDIEAAVKSTSAGESSSTAPPFSGEANSTGVPEFSGMDPSAVPLESVGAEPTDKPPDDARRRDSTGRFTKTEAPAVKTATPMPKGAGVSDVSPKTANATAVPAQGTSTPSAPELKAPQAWKPAAREKWAAIPPEIQAEIVRVENETKTGLREASEAKRFAQEFARTVAPYEGMIRSEGSDPLRAVSNLLQTAAALRTAPPAHKAQLVANLIQAFGVPIEALDAALVGQAPAQAAQQGGGQYRDPRVDQLLASLQQAQEQRSQSLSQSAAKEVAEFQAKEFFEDVRQDVADLLEMASRRGIALSLEEAYNRALKMHPEISGVLAQREAAKSAANGNPSTQRARAAASTVKSQPSGGVMNGEGPRSLRDDILAATASLQGR